MIDTSATALASYARKQGCGLGLETVSRSNNVSVSDQYVSGLVSVLAQNVSASRLGLELFHVVGRDVLCGVRAVWPHSVCLSVVEIAGVCYLIFLKFKNVKT